MWSEVTLISSFVRFDWFCSNCWAFFSSVTDKSRMNKAGCLVVVLVFASVFLHVKISVKVVRVFLGDVTSFWSTFVLGGGGNVTFHVIQVPREYFSINIRPVPLGLSGM